MAPWSRVPSGRDAPPTHWECKRRANVKACMCARVLHLRVVPTEGAVVVPRPRCRTACEAPGVERSGRSHPSLPMLKARWVEARILDALGGSFVSSPVLLDVSAECGIFSVSVQISAEKNQRSPRNTTFSLESLSARIDIDTPTTTTLRRRLRSVHHTLKQRRTDSLDLWAFYHVSHCPAAISFSVPFPSCISFDLSSFGF